MGFIRTKLVKEPKTNHVHLNKKIDNLIKSIKWYDVSTYEGVYGLMKEIANDKTINLDDFPELQAYYNRFIQELLEEEPNEEYVLFLSRTLIRLMKKLGFARGMKCMSLWNLYYWNPYKNI